MPKTSEPQTVDTIDSRQARAWRAARTVTRFASGDAACAAWQYGPGTSGACVVMAHGLGAIKEVGLNRFARRFAAAGHDVLALDYRGFGESTGTPRQVVDIAAQQEDWQAAIEFAWCLPGVARDRIVLWGTSYPGGHVLHLAARLDGVAAAVAQVPMADGLAAARAVGTRQTALAAHGLLDAIGARLGCAPHTVAITVAPGELALLASPDAAAGLEIPNPDGYPWPNQIAARFVLRAGAYRPAAMRRASSARCWWWCATTTPSPRPRRPSRRRGAPPRGELLRLRGCHYAVYEGDGFERAVEAELGFLERHLPAHTAVHLDQTVRS